MGSQQISIRILLPYGKSYTDSMLFHFYKSWLFRIPYCELGTLHWLELANDVIRKEIRPTIDTNKMEGDVVEFINRHVPFSVSCL